MLLYLRSSQKLLTRVDRHRARQGPTTIDFRVFRLCRRTRAFNVAARLVSAKAEALDAWLPSRRPRSPSENHNVKQPVKPTFSRLFSTKHHSRNLRPRSGVGAGYRSGIPPSQTLKWREKRFFCAHCGWTFPPIFRSHILGRAVSIYGASPGYQPRMVDFCCCAAPVAPQNGGFPGFRRARPGTKKRPAFEPGAFKSPINRCVRPPYGEDRWRKGW